MFSPIKMNSVFAACKSSASGPDIIPVTSFLHLQYRFHRQQLQQYHVDILRYLSLLPDGFRRSHNAEGLPWYKACRVDDLTFQTDQTDRYLSMALALGYITRVGHPAQTDVDFIVIEDAKVNRRLRMNKEWYHQL